jgi:hypothetical protein
MSPSRARGVGGNVSQRDTVHLILRGPSSATTIRRPDGCHRTTKANIRSRLYGGPQGRNPHFLRTSVYHLRGHKPIEADRSRTEIESSDLQSQCVVRITSERSDTLKSVGSAGIEERSIRTGSPEMAPGDGIQYPNALIRLSASDTSRRRISIFRRPAYFNRNALIHLRASDRDRRQRVHGTATGQPCVTESASATFASYPMAGIHKSPSNRAGYVMRFHARTVPVSRVSHCGTIANNRSGSSDKR